MASGPNTNRITRSVAKTPVLTTATACRSALTGVGATMAAGSQLWSGITAFLANPKRNSAKTAESSAGWAATTAAGRMPPGRKSSVPATL